MGLTLYNTMSRRKELFEPLTPPLARMYCCGPTVYNVAHIGNLRTYLFEDVLRRLLVFNGYEIQHVMNITDVGHMTTDEDAGDDKMEVAAKREGKSPWEIARFYEEVFFKDTDRLNIQRPEVTPRATEHVVEMIAIIQQLEENGFTYQTSEAVYFDTSKNADYGKLARLNLSEQRQGAREDVITDETKKNPSDFVLWFLNKPTHIMQWESAWGPGYPGWHIECSAMSMKYLGETFDIHCGGVDHIPVHHTNEIAQSECATHQPFVKYWVHGEFLLMNGGKLSKSELIKIAPEDRPPSTLQELIDRGYDPMAYRYLCLQAHYRSELNFSVEALEGATAGLRKVYALSPERDELDEAAYDVARKRVFDAMNDDMGMPQAVGILNSYDSYRLWVEFDAVLGLNIEARSKRAEEALPAEVLALVDARNSARKAKEWAKSDTLRNDLIALGYEVGDGPQGTTVKRRTL